MQSAISGLVLAACLGLAGTIQAAPDPAAPDFRVVQQFTVGEVGGWD